MQRIAVIVLALGLVTIACGGAAPEAKRTSPPVIAAAPKAVAKPAKAMKPATVIAAALPDIGCATPTCAFHAGAAGYFKCLVGGAGACFHFGAPCTPEGACMFDPADHSYKRCSNPVEGKCLAWAAACAPASACMFDVADGLHHHCDDIAGGSCKKYGALCAP